MNGNGEWCNCQAIPGSVNYPGPWHPAADEEWYPCSVQADTVRHLNDLTPEHDGRVRAAAVTDDYAAELCQNDTAHGPGMVVFAVSGELCELCPDCAVQVIDGMLRDGRVVSDSNDLIDVEVYR